MAIWAEYRSVREQAETLAALVASQLSDALESRGKASLAVPGGTTPKAFLEALSAINIEWPSVQILLTDERFVQENSLRSNTRLLRETFLKNAAKQANLVPMTKEGLTPESVLSALHEGIAKALPLDIAVLGMGADSHIASLFPGADRLGDGLDLEGLSVVLPMRAPGAPEPRLTLTAPVFASAHHVHLLIRGAEKMQALKQAEIPGPMDEAPVRLLLNHVQNLTIHYCEAVD